MSRYFGKLDRLRVGQIKTDFSAERFPGGSVYPRLKPRTGGDVVLIPDEHDVAAGKLGQGCWGLGMRACYSSGIAQFGAIWTLNVDKDARDRCALIGYKVTTIDQPKHIRQELIGESETVGRKFGFCRRNGHTESQPWLNSAEKPRGLAPGYRRPIRDDSRTSTCCKVES